MNNFDVARQALEVSLNSSGSAMREHSKWSESLEARLNKLKSTWQSLSQTFMNSDFLKSCLDVITSLVNGFDKLIDTIGVIPTLLATFGVGKFITNIVKLGGAITSFNDILDVLKISFPTISRLGSSFISNLSNAFNIFLVSMANGSTTIAALKTAISSLTATMSINPYLAVAAAVAVVIAAYNKWKKAAEELAQKVENLTSEYRSNHDALMKLKGDYDTSNEDSMISRYEKLSKGVNELGENVSLTAEEYSEYQSIVDTIANQMPHLVTGYNSQGDAILGCVSSVEDLTNAYKELILEQNKLVLDSGEDIFKDFGNDMKTEYKRLYGMTHETSELSQIKDFKRLLTGDADVSDISTASVYAISKLLEEQGIERDVLGSGEKGYESFEEHIERALKEDIDEVKSILDDATADLNAYSEELGEATNAYFSTAFLGGDGEIGDYSHFSNKMQNIISQITSGFDTEFYSQFLDDENPYESLTNYYESMLSAFDNLGSDGTKRFEAAFNLKTQFNNGDIDYGEYISSLKEAEGLIDSLALDDDIKNQIKLILNTDKVESDYEALKKRLTSDKYNIQMDDKEARAFLDGLTSSEYQVAVDLIASGEVDLSKFDIDSLRAYIEKEAKLLDALNYTISIDVETESIEALNTAMAESVSGAGLSSEVIAALKSRYAELEGEGYNLSAMFEETANGIHLNREAVSELEQKLASDKLAETDKQLGVLKNRYDELTTEIDNCTDASDRAALYTEQQSIVDKINDLATLASQYEGLTSAYNAWITAEESGSERDMYEGIIEGFETVGDEISRGWVDDGTIKFLELLTGKTGLAAKSGKELKEIYDSLDDTIKNTTYSVSDFFTVDEDGNSTNTGVYNFLDALQELESSDTVSSVLKKQFKDIDGIEDLVEIKDGNIVGFNFEVVGGDKAVADALGISEELVQIMVRAADDAGFVVNLEGAYTQLANLKTEAELARDTLISLQKNGLEKLKGIDVNFNLDAEGNDLLKEQEEAVKLLDKFKDKNGKIDLTMEGAQQALDIAEYLTIKLDDLTEPKIMQIDTSEVDEDLREPIEKMQEIVDLSKEKNLVTLTGDTKEIEEAQSKINEVAKELEELDPEIKAQVGIDEDWDAETIASKIEKGEVEIPASLELDVQMSDDLKDIRLLMMDNLGLTADGEVELKIKYGIDDSTADKLIKDDKAEIVVEYITENEKEFNKLTDEEKEVVVKLIANGVDLEKYEVEDKEAIVNYIANGEEADGWTPEAKDAFVKYLADGGEIDKFDPKNKESWVVYDTDTTKPDGYEPDDEDATVTYDKDSSVPDGYDPNDPKATVTYNKDSSNVDSYNPPSFTRFVKFIASLILPESVKNALAKIGISIADGTANAEGTAFIDGTSLANGTSGRAFKQGDWRTKKSETALTGELGQELVVTGNRWYTVGDNGAEFAHIPKGSIVFNHKICGIA